MAKSTNKLRLVQRIRRDLHTPHLRHVVEERHQLGGGGLDGARRRLAVVTGERNRGLDGERRGVGGDRTAEMRGVGEQRRERLQEIAAPAR